MLGNSKKLNVLLFSGVSLSLVLAFQNCSQVDFDKLDGELVAKSEDSVGAPMGDFDDRELDSDLGVDDLDNSNDVAGDESDADKDDSDNSDYVADDDSDDDTYIDDDTYVADDESYTDSPGKSNQGKKNNNQGGNAKNEDNMGKSPKSSGEGLRLCGLAAPGSSLVVGFRANSSALGSQHSTSSAVCMSVDACLNIVSQAFEVKGPVRGRGICKPGKSNVSLLTDDEVQILIDNLL